MVEFTPKQQYSIQDLLQVVQILRSPEGCPWDRQQSHESIRMNFVEETYEVLDAIAQKDAPLLCEELGDVLLHVIMHSQMEAEKGTFTFEDVCNGVCKKMVYRHPHVFGNAGTQTTDEVINAWELLKNKEKNRNTAQVDLESVPNCLPALMRAAKAQKRAERYGVSGPDLNQALVQMEQQIAQLRQKIQQGDAVQQQVGKLLFSAVNTARLAQADAEDALNQATNVFIKNVIDCEQNAKQQGKTLADLHADELQALWP